MLIWNRYKQECGGASEAPCRSSEHISHKVCTNEYFSWKNKTRIYI